MTAEEKQSVYRLLKTAATWSTGYAPSAFRGPEPSFADDLAQAEISCMPEGQAARHSGMEQTNEHSVEPLVPLSPNDRSEVSDTEAKKPELTGSAYRSLSDIARTISACRGCVLCQKRLNTVPGEGVENPAVLVVGEGPGEDEDKTGRPFVGRAGQLLDKMLSAISLDRTCNCYIANIVKCRPPMNRAPMPDEANACSAYLESQILLLKPALILAVGRTAAQNLLKTSQGINSLRGKFFDRGGIPLLATYHPSALLRDESLKRPAWNDLKTFRERLLSMVPVYAEPFEKKHASP